MPAFYTGMETVMSDTDFVWIRGYLTWNLLRSTSSLLSQRFLDEQFEWSRTLYGTKEPTARYLDLIDDNFDFFRGGRSVFPMQMV